jgi:hypothetical protein
MNKSRFTIYALLFFLMPAVSWGMQSNLYKIKTDTINVGGVESSSNTYIIDDTLGEQATGESESATYALHAGFWQMQESSIAINSPSDLVLASINGLSGGTSDGEVVWNVTTDNDAGYMLMMKAGTSPALKSAVDSFSDYTPVGGTTPDYSFSVNPAGSVFAFTPQGTDIASTYKDNGSTCNTGSLDTTDACWDGLSILDKVVSQSSSSNHPSGTNTTVKFRAASGASHIQSNGTYTAAITVTAVTL